MHIGFERFIYGHGNDDIDFASGMIGYEEAKEQYRTHRVYFAGASMPGGYTMNFMEALMTGAPIVAPGVQSSSHPEFMSYEVCDIIRNGENGFCSDDPGYLRYAIERLMNDDKLAQRISRKARETALEYFSYEKIRVQWEDFWGNFTYVPKDAGRWLMGGWFW